MRDRIEISRNGLANILFMRSEAMNSFFCPSVRDILCNTSSLLVYFAFIFLPPEKKYTTSFLVQNESFRLKFESLKANDHICKRPAFQETIPNPSQCSPSGLPTEISYLLTCLPTNKKEKLFHLIKLARAER